MAVYTHLRNKDQLHVAERYGLARIVSLTPIAEGVENSNYLMVYEDAHTQSHRAILTVFEQRVESEALPFFLGLKQHLHHRGISCPTPYQTIDGKLICELQGKPAALVRFLDGQSVEPPQMMHIQQAGHVLAQMHLAAEGFSLTRPNRMAMDEWKRLYAVIDAHRHAVADTSVVTLLKDELAYQEAHWPTGLPSGIIHGDLFPNNVFFDDTGTLCGVIDFYFACHELLAYDLAIVANAWCTDQEGQLRSEDYQALIESYHAVRPLTPAERNALPTLLRAAALRFLLTRQHDVLVQDDDALVTPHDPEEYIRILEHHRSNS